MENRELRFFNGTAHAVNLFAQADVTFDAATRKYIAKEGAEPIASIPPSGTMLNAEFEEVEAQPFGIWPTSQRKVKSCDTLPEEYDAYIVSFLYAQAFIGNFFIPENAEMFIVGDIVYRDDKQVGCLKLLRV